MSTISEEGEELPRMPSETSRGSSVSTGLQEEYDELIKYAIVTPKWDPSMVATESTALPQLRLSGPDQNPLTTIEEYSAVSTVTTRTEEDSAVGSEEPETARKQSDAAWQLSNPEEHTPRPMASPGRTPYRGPMLSPSPTSTSVQSDPIPSQPFAISAYLKNPGVEENVATRSRKAPTKDPHMERMNGQLDQWYGKLKTMVLAELSQTKIAIGEDHRRNLREVERTHREEVDKLQDEISQLKELLRTYEVSVGRKDQVISNLTRAVQTGQDRLEMARRMMQWKLRMMDEKRQNFTTHLARKHRERAMSLKAWQAWRSTVEARWKEKVEKACQKKAQEVCLQLTEEYEDKIAELTNALKASRNEVAGLHKEREKYEDNMKKAFMRGVCALNLEAMSMFQGDENQAGPSEVQTLAAAVDALQCASEGNGTGATYKFHPASKPEYVHSDSEPTRLPYEMSSASVNFSEGGIPSRPKSSGPATKGAIVTGKFLSNPPIRNAGGKHPVNRSRTLSAKIAPTTTGKRNQQGKSDKFGPPPHGVLVERHHPNLQNYQTEQALCHAVKYPYTPTKDIIPSKTPKG